MRVGPNSSKCTASIRHGQQGPNFGPTWTHLVPTSWAQLGVKLSPKGSKLHHFGSNLDFHVRHMASICRPGSIWIALGQLQPNMTNAPAGSKIVNLGPSWDKLGPLGGTRAQVGPNRCPIVQPQCALITGIFLKTFSNVFWL